MNTLHQFDFQISSKSNHFTLYTNSNGDNEGYFRIFSFVKVSVQEKGHQLAGGGGEVIKFNNLSKYTYIMIWSAFFPLFYVKLLRSAKTT